MTAVLVVSSSGLQIAQKIAVHFNASLQGQFEECDIVIEKYPDQLKSLFIDKRPIIFIGALGILVRLIAPFITKKEHDPPVVVVAEDGSSVIPVLGGHSGANKLAKEIGKFINSPATITTASDLHFNVALDTPPKGWHLQHDRVYKKFMAKLLNGESIKMSSKPTWLENTSLPFSKNGKLSIHVTEKQMKPDASSLTYSPECLAIGIGCERNVTTNELVNLVKTTLSKHTLYPNSIAIIVSIDLKMDEEALHQLSLALKKPLRFFNAAKLELETPRLLNPSNIVFKEVGCHGVAEAAALAAAGPMGELIVPKQKSKRATCAIAKSPSILVPKKIGLERGKLLVIGTGPGKQGWLTPEANELISFTSDLVGYKLYLDLLGNATNGKTLHRYELGEERDRVIRALDIAAEGKTVGLISSGDPGIYAMASLVFDCLKDFDKASWNVLDILVSPGISAVQACAAKAGAPLGHDFCTISLSDLLTPWSIIEQRIKAATQGDFVIALYNPASGRRRNQLVRTLEIVRQGRGPQTPVIIGRSLGRPEEKLEIMTIQDFKPDTVDMLSIVIVGSTQTEISKGRVFTPRGYLINNNPNEIHAK